MDYIQCIENYKPVNEQETEEKRVILEYCRQFPHNVLLRSNEIAHITSSGFIMNPELNKVLLVHHNIRNVWSWTGGHADGDKDLLYVAQKEAGEETGVKEVEPLFEGIASIDILQMEGHVKNGKYVPSHLHLSAAFILICGENQPLKSCPGENTGVQWFPAERFTKEYFSPYDVYLYNKLIQAGQMYKRGMIGK